jgi:hypothetical protein
MRLTRKEKNKHIFKFKKKIEKWTIKT